MEKLYTNLSEEEFSKGRKVLLWIFSSLFFLAGIWVLILSLVLGHRNTIPAILSAAPFGISLVVGIIGVFATVKRKDLYFLIDDEKIEFRYGLLRATRRSFNWIDIEKFIMPHKEKKVYIAFKDGSSYVINLIWLHKKKSALIRKHLYNAARDKDVNVITVKNLVKKA
jgi:hypothetical protein